METKEEKLIGKYLDEISDKFKVLYGVSLEEAKLSKHPSNLAQVQTEQEETKQMLKDLKIAFVCENTESENKEILPILRALQKNFRWNFIKYEYTVIKTGCQPYIKDTEKQKEKFDGYFESLNEIGKRIDSKQKVLKTAKNEKPAER